MNFLEIGWINATWFRKWILVLKLCVHVLQIHKTLLKNVLSCILLLSENT